MSGAATGLMSSGYEVFSNIVYCPTRCWDGITTTLSGDHPDIVRRDRHAPGPVEQVKNDSKEVFYLNLGSRLSQVDVASEEGRCWCKLLLEMCLRHGPRDFDMAVFVLAHQGELTLDMLETPLVSAYVQRLGGNVDKRLSFLPLLRLLGYREETLAVPK